jgi:hypothetical protein
MGDSRFLIDLIKHAQQLERELSEARREADRQTEIANAMTEYMGDEAALIKERDQLRKVCDWFATSVVNRDLYGDKPAIAHYNSLPHVIERNKSK